MATATQPGHAGVVSGRSVALPGPRTRLWRGRRSHGWARQGRGEGVAGPPAQAWWSAVLARPIA